MRTVTKENLIAQIDRLRKIKDEQGQLSMSGEYTLQAYEMLLATMGIEPVEMPLDYLQGHKDGLEWASQLAEANHPETGDWLYDDPIELAKAIRKGPDMPPAQLAPVVPDEIKRNPQSGWYVGPDGKNWSALEAVGWNKYRAAMLEADPQLPGSEPATLPGKWIPVSEQMPENKPGSYEYLVFETLNNRVNHDYWNVPDKDDEAFTPFWNHYGNHVTHWMPFPTFNQK